MVWRTSRLAVTSAGWQRPRRLVPGDRVGLVAPAGPVPQDLLDRGAQILRSWGLQVRIGDHVLDRHPRLGYLAGTDADRAADLEQAWLDPDLAAVLCVRGGYGSHRVIDLLDWDAMTAAGPKVFAGSSDITALHTVWGQRLRLVTLFAPMVATTGFVDDPIAREHLRRTLFEPEATRVLTGAYAETLVPGTVRGRLVGGNLSLLACSLGTNGQTQPSPGTLALLEDVNEDGYRIDRYITQLVRAGWFRHVDGIALGSWGDCGPLAEVREVLADRLRPLGVPIIWQLGFGHVDAAVTMPLGTLALLDADTASVTVSHAALT